jgi:hypothetical protein
MFGKIFAGLVMGVVVAVLAMVVVGLGAGGGESGGRASLWAMAIGFAATVVLAISAQRARYAWGRGLLAAGLLCFALPLAAILFTGVVGADSVGGAVGNAQKAGAMIGTAIGGGIVTIASGLIGFFLGLIFLVGSYFSLRKT